MPTLATHLITTTYGTWLPGDDRGHWSPLFDFYGHLRDAGHHLNIPDAPTQTVARSRMTEPERVVTPDDEDTVARALENIFTTPHRSPSGDVFRPPTVYAAAIERTHTHLLLGTMREELTQFVGRIKGMTASAVLQAKQDDRRHVWTTGYWHVFLFDHAAVDAAQEYIQAHNVRRGLPPAPFTWVHPRRVRGG